MASPIHPHARRLTDAIPTVTAPHEVDDPPTGLELHSGGDDVVGGGPQHPAPGPHRHDRARGLAAVDVCHRARRGRQPAPGAQDHVALDDLLDRHRTTRRLHAGPRGQALVGITDDADVAVLTGQQHDELVLDVVGVLVLVDQHVAEALAVVGQHVGVLADQPHRVGQQIVEVHGAGPLEPSLVLPVDVGQLALEDDPRPRRVRLDVEALVLGRADRGVHRPGREALGVEVEVADHITGQPHGIGLVVDGERRRVAEQLAVAAQDADAGRVEGGHPHLLGHRAHQGGHAVLHLVGGLVGERDGQDLERRDAPLADEEGDAVGEHPGLARPRSGDDQQRPLVVRDRLGLDRVQPVEEVVGAIAGWFSGLFAGWFSGAGERVEAHGGPTLAVACDTPGGGPGRLSRGRGAGARGRSPGPATAHHGSGCRARPPGAR